MEESLLKPLLDMGAIGILAGVLLYQVLYLQKRIVSIIENNTKAFFDLKGVIDKCQYIHDRDHQHE